MKLREISRQLPNGFHGAEIERLSIDYRVKSAEIAIKIEIADESGRGGFRCGRLRIDGLAYCSLDVPDQHYDYRKDGPIEIGGLLDTTEKLLPNLQQFRDELGDAYFFHSFFVEEWNRFIHFAGTEAAFEWTE